MKKTEFLERVSTHKLEVLLDAPEYKHLRFQKPDTTDQYFTLMFYPGYCVFAGDMGEWVFSRTRDMMAFFRGEEISPTYWAEKCKATSRFGRGDSSDEFYNFNEDEFKKYILNYVQEFIDDEENEIAAEDAEALLNDVKSEVINGGADYGGEYNYMRLLTEYGFKIRDNLTFEFVDAWEWQFRDFTGYFLFACRAIQWGISQYDEQKIKHPAREGWKYVFEPETRYIGAYHENGKGKRSICEMDIQSLDYGPAIADFLNKKEQ